MVGPVVAAGDGVGAVPERWFRFEIGEQESNESPEGIQEGELVKMINVEDSIVISRPVEKVFAFLSDQTNAPRWQSGLLEVQRITDGPIGIGARHKVVRKFMGKRLEAANEYVGYEPNKEITFTGTAGPSVFKHSYLTETTAEGTKVTSRMEMQSKGLFGLAEPLIASSLRREMQANLAELKDLLENTV